MPIPLDAEQICEINFPAKAERLYLVRTLVRCATEKAGCSEQLSEQLVIALNEACMNVIQHAYKDDDDNRGIMSLNILKNGGYLYFRLRDHAPPIDLDGVKPRNLDDVRPGGLGVHFIREIMDDCEMGHLDRSSGNYLEMTKKIE
jgi:anti-sigma regulatory factor (Ser/Thr protein kinase)